MSRASLKLWGEVERTPVLSVVPPSGRRPWPLSPASGTPPPFRRGPHPVKFAYPVDYTRPRQRRTVRSWVTGHAFVELQTASASEVQTAFRIVDVHGGVTEVLHYAGDLWWSIPGRPSASEFLECLARGENAAIGLLGDQLVPGLPPVSDVDKLRARKIMRDSHDETTARVQSGAAELVVVENEVFVRDGSPVYVVWDGRRVETPGNNVLRVLGTLNSIAKSPAFEDLSDALVFGTLFGANAFGETEKLAVEAGIKISIAATVDVVLPDLICTDPFELQTDAVFRKLLRLVSIGRPVPREALREIRTMLKGLRESGAPNRTSRDRARALNSFVEWCDRGPEEWKSKFRVERRFAADAIERIRRESARRLCHSPFDEHVLLPDEESALLDLGP